MALWLTNKDYHYYYYYYYYYHHHYYYYYYYYYYCSYGQHLEKDSLSHLYVSILNLHLISIFFMFNILYGLSLI